MCLGSSPKQLEWPHPELSTSGLPYCHHVSIGIWKKLIQVQLHSQIHAVLLFKFWFPMLMQPHDLLLYSDILYVVRNGQCVSSGDFFAGISVQVIFFDNRAWITVVKDYCVFGSRIQGTIQIEFVTKIQRLSDSVKRGVCEILDHLQQYTGNWPPRHFRMKQYTTMVSK